MRGLIILHEVRQATGGRANKATGDMTGDNEATNDATRKDLTDQRTAFNE